MREVEGESSQYDPANSRIIDIVRTRRIDIVHAPWNVVELKLVARAPSDIVVGAGGIAAHANSAHKVVAAVVKRKPAAEHIDAATRRPTIGSLGWPKFAAGPR
jgi:hypothetical protein